MKQLYTTLVLFFVVAAMGGWIYFREREPVAPSGSTVLLRLEPEKVSALTVRTQDGQRLEFSRKDADWRVQSGGLQSLDFPADAQQVQACLEALRLVQSGAIVENKAGADELESYGLANPRSSIATGDAKIEFGNQPTFDVTQIYARVTSNFNRGGVSQIALLPVQLAAFSLQSLDDWRDKSILNLEPKSVLRFSIQTPNAKIAFERDAQNQVGNSGEWKMNSPVRSLADAALVTLFLQQISQTKIKKFLEDAPKQKARWGLAQPQAKIEIAVAGKGSTSRARALLIGKPVAGGMAAQNSASSAVFVLPAEVMALVSRPLRDWRDKSVLKFNTGRLQTMKVLARGKQMEFEQIEGNWRRRDGENAKKYHAAALEISFALQEIKAIDLIDEPQNLNSFGLDKPVLQLQLTSEEWSGERTVQFGQANGKIYARVVGQSGFSSVVLALPSEALDGFQISLNVMFSNSKPPQVSPQTKPPGAKSP